MWERLRPWLEVLIVQVAIYLVIVPLGLQLASLATMLLVFSGLVQPGPEGFGVLGALMLVAAPAMIIVFALLWFLAWRFWFRQRMSPGRFLLAWAVSLFVVPLVSAVWSILASYYQLLYLSG